VPSRQDALDGIQASVFPTLILLRADKFIH